MLKDFTVQEVGINHLEACYGELSIFPFERDEKQGWIAMDERRRVNRLVGDSEVTITVLSDEGTKPKEIVCCMSKDVSVLGTKIQFNYFIPVNTLIKIDFNLKDLYQKITAIGKIIWINAVHGGESYEAGIQFIDSIPEESRLQEHYVTGKSQ